MTDPVLYHLITPTGRVPCRSLAEASQEWRRLRDADPTAARASRLVAARPRNRHVILARMLAERGLGHLRVWYRHQHIRGWMINEADRGEEGMQLLGGSFREAAEFIRGGILEWCYLGSQR